MANPDAGAAVAADTEIASRIEEAMTEHKVSLLALSNETGIAYPTLRRSIIGGIKGHRSLSISELGAIAAALRVRPSTLITQDAA